MYATNTLSFWCNMALRDSLGPWLHVLLNPRYQEHHPTKSAFANVLKHVITIIICGKKQSGRPQGISVGLEESMMASPMQPGVRVYF